MGHEVTIGGERLGSGKKMKAHLHNYERSTHDLNKVWRSTMAAGTLVPFWTEVALPGDTFDINLNVDVLTHPTIGPLFGSYKVQLDVFQIPIRLYQAKLHMNMIGIGMDMSAIKLPQLVLQASPIDTTRPIDNQQINASAIFSYLGIRGIGWTETNIAEGPPERRFNAIPYLGYWDIYKNYYANKQEEIGAVIHKDVTATSIEFVSAEIGGEPVNVDIFTPVYEFITVNKSTIVVMNGGVGAAAITELFDPHNVRFGFKQADGSTLSLRGDEVLENWAVQVDINQVTATGWKYGMTGIGGLSIVIEIGYISYDNTLTPADDDIEPKVTTFPLSNIDDMRQLILQHFDADAFLIQPGLGLAPYTLPMQKVVNTISQIYSQEGLALKTYNSDLFNNWISTEWIDGANGISEVTAIDTTGGSFTIDELNMSKKIYNMLNRIAISGGTYDDWLDAVYTETRTRSAENPMYLGGLIDTLVFQEVVSNSESSGQPLGTLAGRGKLTNNKKGGHIVAKIDEPSYLMGIVSLTPRIDYSQGNKWDVNIKTMNDFHKPALDEIGYQDLITDQMAWFDTRVELQQPTFKSAGKQPAWINYMTNVNEVRGNFADQTQQMFMVLNRRYEVEYGTAGAATTMTIQDLTTYIDPSQFNHIFADTRRDAQNFWVQIGMNVDARRKMSAKVIPNL